MSIYNRDMKNYKAKDQVTLFKSIVWAVIAVIALIGIIGKMAQDEESFRAEQTFKLERE